MGLLDILENKKAAASLPDAQYYRETPSLWTAITEGRHPTYISQAYQQDLKPAYDAWEPELSDLYEMPLGLLDGVVSGINGVKDQALSDAANAFTSDEATEQAAKSSFDLAAMVAGGGGLLGKADEAGEGLLGMNVWQGSPHKYGPDGASQSLEHMGKGEGAQAYGWGRYDAGDQRVGQKYKDDLASDVYTERDGTVFDPSSLEHLNVRAGLRKHGGDIDALIASDRIQGMMAHMDGSGKHTITEYDQRFARDMDVLKGIQDRGGLEKTSGYLYRHDLPDEDVARYMDWDKPLSEQPQSVQDAFGFSQKPQKTDAELRSLVEETGSENPAWKYRVGPHGIAEATIDGAVQRAKEQQFDRGPLGEKAYKELARGLDDGSLHDGGYRAASEALGRAGIPGLRYLDGNSRGAGEGSHNYVTWDQDVLDRMKLLERNGETFTAGGKGAAPLLALENDLLNPPGMSRMVGAEDTILDTDSLKATVADTPWTKKRSYRYVQYEDGEPVAVLQFQTAGPRSKKATIQNVYTVEGKRRQGYASRLLRRAQQDFDIRHSNDLTDDGRKFKKADGVAYSGGATGLLPMILSEQDQQLYNKGGLL